ncbi:MAG: carboxymuconolactone decarboxylase family protein [Reyranellaceae bacterium]
MERFPTIAAADLSPEQAELVGKYKGGWRSQLFAGGERLPGPFSATIYAPEMAKRISHLGDYFRFETSLPESLVEMTILIVARLKTSQYEWHVHRPWAEKAGLDPAIADDIAQGKRPAGMSPEQSAVYDLVVASHEQATIGDAVFAAARRHFNERQLVELVALCGYYNMIAQILNAAEVLPPGGAAPLRDLK